MYYLAIDTETGGIDSNECSLLTGYLEILDEDLSTVSNFSFALKHKVYRVTAKAMEINRINLVEHDKNAKSSQDVTSSLSNWFIANEVNQPLIPLGQNINFDVGFLKAQLPDVAWNSFMHYRLMDTQVVARFLQTAGKLPATCGASLADLSKHFELKDLPDHTADKDVKVTIEVFRKLKEILK